MFFYIKTENTTDNIVIKDNYVASDTRPYRFVGSGISKNWQVSNNTFEHPCLQKIPGNIKIDNLVMKNNKKKD